MSNPNRGPIRLFLHSGNIGAYFGFRDNSLINWEDLLKINQIPADFHFFNKAVSFLITDAHRIAVSNNVSALRRILIWTAYSNQLVH